MKKFDVPDGLKCAELGEKAQNLSTNFFSRNVQRRNRPGKDYQRGQD